jgi:hypothetical protein
MPQNVQVTTRLGKGSQLTFSEMDNNLTALQLGTNTSTTSVDVASQIGQAIAPLATTAAVRATTFDASQITGLPGNLTLAQWAANVNAFIQTGGASAPTTASAPTIAGTTTVGQTLTGTLQTVTTTGGHGSASDWQFNRENATNPRAIIPGASAVSSAITSPTYVLQPADYNFYISLTQTPVDTVTGTRGAARTSSLTTIVSGTAPTNSVAPSISPTGTQLGTQVLTVAPGTWANASTYGYLFYDNGVAVGVRSTTTTFTPGIARAGHTITADVIAYSSLGIPSATAVTSSNSVAISGTNTVINTVLPTFGGTTANNVQQTVNYTVLPGTWTLNGTVTASTSTSWDYYTDKAVSGTYVLQFNSGLNNTVADINPTFWPIGTHLKIVENATINGQAYSSSLASATIYTVAAAPVTFTAVVNNANIVVTVGQAIAPITPVYYTGGTPGQVVFSAAWPAGLIYNTQTGLLQGTTTATVGTYSVVVTMKDPSSNVATATVTVAVQSAVTIPIAASLIVSSTFAQQGGNLQFCNEYPLVNTIPETGFLPSEPGFTFAAIPNTASLPGSNGGLNRFFKSTLGGRSCIIHSCAHNDPQLGGALNAGSRCDVLMGGDNAYAQGATIWQAVRGFVPGVCRNDPNIHGVLMDIHGNDDNGGMYFMWEGSATGYSPTGNNGMFILAVRNIGIGDVTIMEVTSYIPTDTWFDLVIKMTFQNQNGSALTAAWVNPTTNSTAICSTTDANAIIGSTSSYPMYPKAACYSAPPPPITNGNYWGYSSMIVVRDAGYTPQQIQALLT